MLRVLFLKGRRFRTLRRRILWRRSGSVWRTRRRIRRGARERLSRRKRNFFNENTDEAGRNRRNRSR